MSVITYDDRDTIINYSSGWTRGGNTADVDGTSTWTTVNGSTATITFTGVQISVYGTIPVILPKTTSSYSIDGGPPTLFTAPFQIQGSGTANTYFFQQLYYQSPILTPNTPHTLVVTSTVNSGTQFFLDFMKVEPASSTSTSPTPTGTTTTSTQQTTTSPVVIPPTTSSSSTSTSASTATTLLSLTSNSSSTAPISSTSSSQLAASEATTSPAVNKSSPPSTGLIVGSVIGGLAVVLLGIGLCLLWRIHMRRRNRAISAAPTLHPFPPSEYQYAPPGTPGPESSVTGSYSMLPTGKKSHDPMMVQNDYASVSDPRHSDFTLLDHAPPQYER
ncbi:hypothetical protein BJ912DRAFT_95600 [Pholiota molesta]|nr:hypothetical protein BJ912DRAFT_95600 [Pholiota molesta]